jgi:AcrR family transcriptional regulator
VARPADPQRRATILRAATEVFTEQGFSDTRLADIAQRAGVVISTLYLYFDSKEEMVRAISQESRQVLLDRLEPVVAQLRTSEDIARFVEIVLAFAKEHREQIIIFNLDSGLISPRRGIKSTAHTYGPRIQQGIELIRHLIAEGWLRPYEPELIMEILITTTRWLISRYLIIKEEEELQLKDFCVQWLSNALLANQNGRDDTD